jgi:diguanylate cyclase (GGDEF)-like protein/PAS domain S-box-containing protein
MGLLVCSALEPGFPIVYASASFERLTLYAAADVVGKSCHMLQGPDTDRDKVALMARALRNGQECRVVVLNYRGDGEPFWNEVFLSPLKDAAGTIVSYVGVQHDVTARVRHDSELTHMALHDALTGLPNRRLLEDRIRMALERSARDDSSVALLMLDLDRFKRVNDSLGHGAGDALLSQVASRLSAALRSSDTVARLSGDEFAVLCEPELSSASVEAVAMRALSVFAEPFQLGPHRLPVTSSVGIAISHQRSTTVETMLREADAAMYRAKRRGQGLAELFDPSAHDITVKRLALEVELHQALEAGALHVEYQPKVDLSTGAVSYVEALVRWKHPGRGHIAPAVFIPVAEATGLIRSVGRLRPRHGRQRRDRVATPVRSGPSGSA